MTSFSMPFTSADGVVHPNGVWIPLGVNIDGRTKTGRFTFYGYDNPASYGAGASDVSGIVKMYRVSGAVYAAVIGTTVASGAASDAVASAVCAYALSVLDTVDKNNPTGPKVSFFQYATPNA